MAELSDSSEEILSEYGTRAAPHVQQQEKTSYYVVLLTLLSVIGGFLFGYDTGVVAAAVILLKKEFHMNNVWQEAFVSVTLGLAAICSMLSGLINDRFGRKCTILVSSIFFISGSIVLAVSVKNWELIAGRAVVGVGIGFSSSTIPMYIAECAPRRLRGQLVTLNNLFITFGQFAASIVGGVFSRNERNGWRFMLGLAAVPAAFQLIGLVFMPESPRWLVSRNRIDEARTTLKLIRGSGVNIDAELKEILETERDNQDKKAVLVRILTIPHVRWALFIGVSLQAFQQLTGINTVMYYSATIIQMSGVHDASTAIWLSAVTSSINFLFSFVALYLVERIGRRPLVLISLAGTMVSLTILAVGFQLSSSNSPHTTYTESFNSSSIDPCSNLTSCHNCVKDDQCGFCYINLNGRILNGSCVAVAVDPIPDRSLYGRCSQPNNRSTFNYWAHEYCPNPYAWSSIVGLVLYLTFFAPGMGPMPWTINSEIYPLWARSTGNSIAACTNWMCNLLISMTFLSLTEFMTRQGAFCLYGILALIGLLFFWLYLPETKGKSLEAIEDIFKGSHIVPCSQRLRSSSYEPLDSSHSN